MNRGIAAVTLPLILLFSTAAAAECIYPAAPTKVPDGKTATQDEMLNARDAFQQYNANMTAFLSCLDMETERLISEAGAQATPEVLQSIRSRQNKRHDAAVDALNTQAAEFNDQIKAFKSKNKS
jgi:hypothetical protein